MKMIRETTEVRQEQIKRAVLELIDEQGLHRVSTRNLANKIGLTEGAIFRHFKTKRDIINGIIDDVDQHLVGKLKQITSIPMSADKKLYQYLCANVKYLKENRGVTILLFSEATHLGDKELKDKLSKILTEQKQFIIQIVNQGINEGIWDNNVNSEDFSTIYLGIPITFNIEYVLNKNNMNAEKFCDRMFNIISKILKK